MNECVDRLHLFRTEKLRQFLVVETVFGEQACGLLLQLVAAFQAAPTHGENRRVFEQHPDAPILTSLSGLGALSGSDVREIGDRDRFTDARNRRAYAGSAPVARQEPGDRGGR
ncbi:MAG: hypothetical protein EOP24_39550 [Hyphomicrobiales bacterium]|nr:MAG: hypothetical protein EOP24_39550 [Hyphomicrobiales bacterium]